MEKNQTIKASETVKNICSCGKVLIPILNKDGIRIGVTHSVEDEDFHLEYWSSKSVSDRIIRN